MLTTETPATARPLTPRQAAVLDAYCRLWFKHGRQPTIREWASAIGSSSPNGAYTHLYVLARKGWVILGAGSKARNAVRLLEIPPGWMLLPGGGIVPRSELPALIEELQRLQLE